MWYFPENWAFEYKTNVRMYSEEPPTAIVGDDVSFSPPPPYTPTHAAPASGFCLARTVTLLLRFYGYCFYCILFAVYTIHVIQIDYDMDLFGWFRLLCFGKQKYALIPPATQVLHNKLYVDNGSGTGLVFLCVTSVSWCTRLFPPNVFLSLVFIRFLWNLNTFSSNFWN